MGLVAAGHTMFSSRSMVPTASTQRIVSKGQRGRPKNPHSLTSSQRPCLHDNLWRPRPSRAALLLRITPLPDFLDSVTNLPLLVNMWLLTIQSPLSSAHHHFRRKTPMVWAPSTCLVPGTLCKVLNSLTSRLPCDRFQLVMWRNRAASVRNKSWAFMKSVNEWFHSH